MLLINILSRRDAGRLLCCASLAIGLAVALDPQQRLVASDPSRYVPKVPYGYFDGQGYFVMDEDRPLTTAVAQEPLGEEARHSANASTTRLFPFAFEPLPLGSIRPQGWLRDQMELMRDGLAGHGFDFYQYVKGSPWMGGSEEYSSLNEAFPYWFNGLVPLAYGLEDDRLKAQVTKTVDYVLGHQAEDGWIGPERYHSERAIWGRFPFFLGLIQLAEANATEAARIVPALHKFMKLMHSMMQDDYAGYIYHPGDRYDPQWGRSRSHDMIITLQWLYEHHPQDNAQILLDNMHFMNDRAYDWSHWFSEGVFPKGDLEDKPPRWVDEHFPFEHGVNAAQGLKAGAVIRRFTHNDTLRESARRGVNWTFRYHGTASGTIIGDERLQGLSPASGSELCTAVEMMYSLSYLYHSIGDKEFADYCELAAYNAMPVMMSPDWWSHQYLTQANQPESVDLRETPFWNVGYQGIIYGLEPNYPCCTSNHPQGYPKFVSSSIVKVGPNGLGHVLLGPVEASARTDNGGLTTIRCETNYPFDNVLYYTIKAEKPVFFYFRVPDWYVAGNSSVSVNGEPSEPLRPDPSLGVHGLMLAGGTSVVVVTLGAEIKVEPRARDTVAVRHGALLYSLDIAQTVETLPARHYGNAGDLPSRFKTAKTHDYHIRSASPWAVAIDPSTLAFHSKQTTSLPSPIWTRGAPPTWMTVQACEIDWPYSRGVPADPPPLSKRKCRGKLFEARLIPFGAAKLHMAELPTMNLKREGTREL